MTVEFEPIVGRYLSMDVAGRMCRMYVEEAGSGIPVLCLHTAGADSRQYRHIMLDPEITQHFRVIAFDMPWHGKSFPPRGYEVEEYRLTADTYTEAILAVASAGNLNYRLLTNRSSSGECRLASGGGNVKFIWVPSVSGMHRCSLGHHGLFDDCARPI